MMVMWSGEGQVNLNLSLTLVDMKGSIGLIDDKTNGSPGRPFIPRNRLKFGKAARIMFSLLLTLLTAPKDILNHD